MAVAPGDLDQDRGAAPAESRLGWIRHETEIEHLGRVWPVYAWRYDGKLRRVWVDGARSLGELRGLDEAANLVEHWLKTGKPVGELGLGAVYSREVATLMLKALCVAIATAP